MKHGKKYLESVKLIERNKLYDPDEAIKLALETAKTKFDETLEISVRLGVDPRQADQQVRGAVVLPNGTGKKVRVLVFAKGDQAKAAEEAGADYVGAEELVAKIQGENWFDFDVVVATPNMMGVVGRLGRVLGPKGLMPNPRAAPSPWTSPRRSPTSRLVRSSTVWTRPRSSTARSARSPSPLSSSWRT